MTALGKRRPLATFVTGGIHAFELTRLLRVSREWLSIHRKADLVFRRPFYRQRTIATRRVLARLREHLAAPGSAAIIAVEAHWTVVRGAAKRRVRVLDSGGWMFMTISSETHRGARRNGLQPSSVNWGYAATGLSPSPRRLPQTHGVPGPPRPAPALVWLQHAHRRSLILSTARKPTTVPALKGQGPVALVDGLFRGVVSITATASCCCSNWAQARSEKGGPVGRYSFPRWRLRWLLQKHANSKSMLSSPVSAFQLIRSAGSDLEFQRPTGDQSSAYFPISA